MGNPYGITEVNVPGILGAYQTAQAQRQETMLNERKMRLQEQQEERKIRMAGAVSKLFGGERAQPSPMPDAYAKGGEQPAGATPSPQAAAPVPRQPSGREILSELAAIDPDEAIKFADAFRNLSEEERAAAKYAYGLMGNAAFQIRKRPDEERFQEFKMFQQRLLAAGVPPKLIPDDTDLSNRSLEGYVAIARQLENMIDDAMPDRIPVQSGGTIYESQPASPFPGFEAGSPPGNMPRPATPADARKLPPGTQFLDPNGVVRTVPGGQTLNPSGTFR